MQINETSVSCKLEDKQMHYGSIAYWHLTPYSWCIYHCRGVQTHSRVADCTRLILSVGCA